MNYKAWFTLLNINNEYKLELLNKYHNEEEIHKNFLKIICLKKNLKNKFANYNDNIFHKKVELFTEKLKKNNITLINSTDLNYPNSLKHLKDRPYALFCKGNTSLLNSQIIAIVGSRNCTNYGINVAKMLTNDLVSYNITIISGGAKGIDYVAHRTALNQHANTIIVLGCGIDICYPKENYNLFEEVSKRGLIISEFLPGTRPFGYNFPRRNRIISALSQAVIVVEASNKSGSLITANYAAEQGKDVLAVPGPIFSKQSQGTNRIICEGAYMLSDLIDMHMLLKLHEKDIKQNSKYEQIIFNIIEDEPKNLDYIENNVKFDREVLINVLFEMQLKNKIVSLPGNYYAKII